MGSYQSSNMIMDEMCFKTLFFIFLNSLQPPLLFDLSIYKHFHLQAIIVYLEHTLLINGSDFND